MAIDIGSAATDRASNTGQNYTYLALDNPANGSGVIDTIAVWLFVKNSGNLTFGSFFLVSGTIYECRHAITVTGFNLGYNEKTGLSLTVESGDLIAIFVGNNQLDIDAAASGGAGIRATVATGNKCVAGNQNDFSTLVADRDMSVYGTGNPAFPSDPVARITSLRHIYRPGSYRLEVGIGAIGLDENIKAGQIIPSKEEKEKFRELEDQRKDIRAMREQLALGIPERTQVEMATAFHEEVRPPEFHEEVRPPKEPVNIWERLARMIGLGGLFE